VGIFRAYLIGLKHAKHGKTLPPNIDFPMRMAAQMETAIQRLPGFLRAGRYFPKTGGKSGGAQLLALAGCNYFLYPNSLLKRSFI